MNCACERDKDGNVVGGCGAHAEWLRKSGVCNDAAHKNHEQLTQDLAYQRRRADLFERLLIEGKSKSV